MKQKLLLFVLLSFFGSVIPASAAVSDWFASSALEGADACHKAGGLCLEGPKGAYTVAGSACYDGQNGGQVYCYTQPVNSGGVPSGTKPTETPSKTTDSTANTPSTGDGGNGKSADIGLNDQNGSTVPMKKIGGISFPSETGLSEAPVEDILASFIYWFIGIFFLLSILTFLISGTQYLLAFGDEKDIEKAKKAMKWSIVGVAVALGAFVIVKAIYFAISATTIVF